MKQPVIVVAQQAGNCVQVYTEANTPTYGKWIEGEGADICLYRSIEDNRLIGVNLPLSSWNGHVVSCALVDDWSVMGSETKLDTIYQAVDALLRLGLYVVVDDALR